MPDDYAEGHPLRKDFPLRGRFSRSEQVRQALAINPEANYSLDELSIAQAQYDLPADMRERLGATSGGLLRPELLMLVLPGPVALRHSISPFSKSRDPGTPLAAFLYD